MGRVLPIFFQTDMVQAIRKGCKTATRRILKPQPGRDLKQKLVICIEGDRHDVGEFAFRTSEQGGSLYYARPPYLPGDILYVRETWSFLPCIECREEGSCGKKPAFHEDRDAESEGCYRYRAGYAKPERITWRPSIHMPRGAARIWLKVKSVKAEHLQDMNAEDLKKEGFLKYNINDLSSEFDKLAVKFTYEDAKKEFARLWDHTIPKGKQDLYGWGVDPWVWVIEFELCGKPEGCHVPTGNA